MNDTELLAAFRAAALPAAEWTHRTHLRVAYLHVKDSPIDDAHILLRVGIIRLNAAHGLNETPGRGYHETITRAWLALIDDAVENPAIDSQTFLAFNPYLLDKETLFLYYSRSRLGGREARARFVDPDRAPLPAASPF